MKHLSPKAPSTQNLKWILNCNLSCVKIIQRVCTRSLEFISQINFPIKYLSLYFDKQIKLESNRGWGFAWYSLTRAWSYPSSSSHRGAFRWQLSRQWCTGCRIKICVAGKQISRVRRCDLLSTAYRFALVENRSRRWSVGVLRDQRSHA